MASSRHRYRPSSRVVGLRWVGLVAALLALLTVAAWAMFSLGPPNDRPAAGIGAPTRSSAPTASPSGSPSPSASPSPSVTPGKLLFGMGDEADRAADTALARQAPVHMLTSWYNQPSDFGEFLDSWRGTLVPRLYAKGYAMHVVEWTPENEGQLTTKYGPACGRAYPLSSAFLNDIRHVGQIFAGTRTGPPLYVTLFTEFSTYPCVDNEWNSATNYYLALKDQYRAAYQILHATAPNVRVSLGFGGWLGTYDYPQKGGGISLLNHFTDLMRMSDFQSFQAMNQDTGENPAQIRAMVRILHPYGPVMLAHYRPVNNNQATFDADMHTILTDAFIKEITAAGLFAMSFMTTDNVDAEPATFAFVKAAVARYGRTA